MSEGTGKIFIRNEDNFYRYLIEIVYYEKMGDKCKCFKVFKNSYDPSDGTELTFDLVKVLSKSDETIYIALKINGISTIESQTFRIFRVAFPYSELANPGTAFTEQEVFENSEFVPVILSVY